MCSLRTKFRTFECYVMCYIYSPLVFEFLNEKFVEEIGIIHGPGSSVVIATDYGLDYPGIESRCGEIFRPSRPVLRPTQPPVQRESSPAGRGWAGRAADHSPPSSAVFLEEESYTSTDPLGHNMACNGNTLRLHFTPWP